MPFTPEDGTGVVGANSYATPAQADDYFTMSGVTAWTSLTNDRKQVALFQATQYIELVWGPLFVGTKFKEDQGLSYPRLLCCTDTVPVYPDALLTACFEYALRASTSPLMPDPVLDETGRQATLQKSKVGPLEEETRWSIPNGQMEIIQVRPYPVPDAMMWSFVPYNSQARVIR